MSFLFKIFSNEKEEDERANQGISLWHMQCQRSDSGLYVCKFSALPLCQSLSLATSHSDLIGHRNVLCSLLWNTQPQKMSLPTVKSHSASHLVLPPWFCVGVFLPSVCGEIEDSMKSHFPLYSSQHQPSSDGGLIRTC